MSKDFDLPESILAVIPTDPYDQLDLARKITSMAIASRVTKLESEADGLRRKLSERDLLVEELQDKVTHLQSACENAELRLRITREDNMKLLKERDSLELTVKKLGRDLAKLETFKRQLVQSLNDENTSTETVDIGTYDQSASNANATYDGEPNGHTKASSYAGSMDGTHRYSITPYISPRLTPTGTPKTMSTSVSPMRRYSTAVSPRRMSGATSPINHHEGRSASISSWYSSSSQQSSAATSPTKGRPVSGRAPRVDGKEFFRQARSRLSLEQFSEFLANVKELNAQKQSREETLRKAEKIFGTENKDLYISFQGLLNRSVH